MHTHTVPRHAAGITLLLVGCGNMGGALLARWQDSGITTIDVIEPHAAKTGWHKNLESLPADYSPSVIVLAVKPQLLTGILPAYRARFAKANPLYISIAAGKTLAFLSSQLGAQAKIVRAMPNTPALAGCGMTVLCASSSLSGADKKTAAQLMQSVGKVEWADESLMDAVTALSGSGPAYVFLFLDALTKAGVAAGLPGSLAKTLALETVAGSTTLAAASPESFEQLRKNVTSPGGTTEAALKVLTKGNALEKLFDDAVQTAAKRSHELK